MKTVHICGLYRADLEGYTQKDLCAAGAQVWTVNDWYRPYPWMMPNRVVNPHFWPHTNHYCDQAMDDPHRYPGDWKAEYNRVIEQGTEIYGVENIEGVNEAGQNLLPAELFEKFTLDDIVCSISACIGMAALEGFERIYLRGVQLDKRGEYKAQMPGITSTILKSKLMGVKEVLTSSGEPWKTVSAGKGLDWTNAEDVNTTTLKHLVGFKLGLKLGQLKQEITQDDLDKATEGKNKCQKT